MVTGYDMQVIALGQTPRKLAQYEWQPQKAAAASRHTGGRSRTAATLELVILRSFPGKRLYGHLYGLWRCSFMVVCVRVTPLGCCAELGLW